MIISIVSGKGGVGKTVCAANLGSTLSKLKYKVLLVDGDIGMKNLDLYINVEKNICYDLINVLNKECAIDEAIVHCNDNLDLLSTSLAASSLDVDTENLINIYNNLNSIYDFIIIDGAKGCEKNFIDSILPCDLAIVIITPYSNSMRTADKILGLITANEKSSFVVINQYDVKKVRKRISKSIEEISELLNKPIMGIIPYDEDMNMYINNGIPIIEKKRSDITKAFMDLSKKISSLAEK